jgi:hypothetical protein
MGLDNHVLFQIQEGFSDLLRRKIMLFYKNTGNTALALKHALPFRAINFA